jgi:hypothetical protein
MALKITVGKTSMRRKRVLGLLERYARKRSPSWAYNGSGNALHVNTSRSWGSGMMDRKAWCAVEVNLYVWYSAKLLVRESTFTYCCKEPFSMCIYPLNVQLKDGEWQSGMHIHCTAVTRTRTLTAHGWISSVGRNCREMRFDKIPLWLCHHIYLTMHDNIDTPLVHCSVSSAAISWIMTRRGNFGSFCHTRLAWHCLGARYCLSSPNSSQTLAVGSLRVSYSENMIKRDLY